MERKDFLRLAGVAGFASMIPRKSQAQEEANGSGPLPMPTVGGGCVLIPSETAGPFPLDLSEDANFFRTDIRELQAGADLRVQLRINGLNSCAGISNMRVDVWHCNADGYYSG
ncbi:MAG: hypothetical protein ABI373_03280, partial [Flavobacteriales bacterium]